LFAAILYENYGARMSERCRDDAALCELVASWHRLTPAVREKFIGIRSAKPSLARVVTPTPDRI
jgi:hypothetical protein